MSRRRDHLRPVELLAIAAGCGLFAGAVTALAVRAWLLSVEVAVGVFVVALVGLAMFELAISPRTEPGTGTAPDPIAPDPTADDPTAHAESDDAAERPER